MATVISEKLMINGADSEVVLDGLDFTGNGFVEVRNAASVTIRNCRVYNIVPAAAKSFWLRIFNDIPVKLTVEHCFFGDNPVSGSNKLYNLFELTAKLLDGSAIRDNYFTDGCCVHNACNIYGCADSAVISISGNHFELNNSIRLGVKGNVPCTIQMRDNVVDANDPAGSPDWDGLVCIQPYATQTKSFQHMRVLLSGNQLPEGQAIYGYSGKTDTMLNEETAPKVIVDGRVIQLPIYH